LSNAGLSGIVTGLMLVDAIGKTTSVNITKSFRER
jgi:hypothetical protein